MDAEWTRAQATRRGFLKGSAAGVAGLSVAGLGLAKYLQSTGSPALADAGTEITFYESPYSSTPVPQAVLFGFDPNAFPTRVNVTASLNEATAYIPLGSDDNVILNDIEFYGSVQYVPGEAKPFKMWSAGLFFSESADGKTWDPPSDMGIAGYDSETYDLLGLTVLYDPDDSTNPYKMAYETQHRTFGNIEVWAAFGSDGTNFTTVNGDPPSPILPFFFEPQGILKKGGLFYLNGQAFTTPRAVHTYSSADFTSWTDEGEGFNRDVDGVAPWMEQAHLGAALWDRNNVVVGIYDMWNEPSTGPGPDCDPPFGDDDSCHVDIDLGLILSYDAVDFTEPIIDFKIQKADDQLSDGEPDTHQNPAITHGQGILNTDSETLLFFGAWHLAKRGLRLATWNLDQLGQLTPTGGGASSAKSTLVEVREQTGRLYVNASGLSSGTAELTINLYDDTGAAIGTHQGALVDTNASAANGFAVLVDWGGGTGSALPFETSFRVEVVFEGAGADNILLHALYIR